ncbi:Ribosome assembly protein 4 [Tolypocladium capitatum]|uniref:Ribosome assembly protein 4 n=1 Tax=Tolypocladium capitatum TaxID=45235 RepID=A0A2K3QNK6_9HYPO|nr:Ribosome assembly protein 4 [Tolypocladium capitatum]
MFGVLEAVTVPKAAIYASCEDLMRDLNNRTEKQGYKIVKARSHRSKPGGPIMRADLVCERGGRPYRCQATKHKTTTKKTNCPWKAKIVDRKSVGGWVLTVICENHNHEPGTPEPPTPSVGSESEGGNEEEEVTGESAAKGPQPDPDTSAAFQVAGVSDAILRLSGDTFQRFKNDYRKMSQPERLGILAQMQLRIAAIYAVQNEDVQRQRRQDAQERRHQEMEGDRQRPEPQGIRYINRQRGPPRIPHTDGIPHSGAPQRIPSAQHLSLGPALGMTELQFEPMPPAMQPGQQPAPPTQVPIRHEDNEVSYQVYSRPPKRLRGSQKSQGTPTQGAQQALPQSQQSQVDL